MNNKILSETYEATKTETQLQSTPRDDQEGLVQEQNKIIDEMQDTNKNLRETLKNKGYELDSMQTQIDTLQQELFEERNRDDISKLRKDLDDWKKRTRVLEKEKQKLKNVVTELQTKLLNPNKLQDEERQELEKKLKHFEAEAKTFQTRL